MGGDVEEFISDPEEGMSDFGRSVVRDFNRDYLAPAIGLTSGGLLEYEGGRVRQRGATKREREARSALQQQRAERARIKQEEMTAAERRDRQASLAGRVVRKTSLRSTGRKNVVEALGGEKDFLGL